MSLLLIRKVLAEVTNIKEWRTVKDTFKMEEFSKNTDNNNLKR